MPATNIEFTSRVYQLDERKTFVNTLNAIADYLVTSSRKPPNAVREKHSTLRNTISRIQLFSKEISSPLEINFPASFSLYLRKLFSLFPVLIFSINSLTRIHAWKVSLHRRAERSRFFFRRKIIHASVPVKVSKVLGFNFSLFFYSSRFHASIQSRSHWKSYSKLRRIERATIEIPGFETAPPRIFSLKTVLVLRTVLVW